MKQEDHDSPHQKLDELAFFMQLINSIRTSDVLMADEDVWHCSLTCLFQKVALDLHALIVF